MVTPSNTSVQSLRRRTAPRKAPHSLVQMGIILVLALIVAAYAFCMATVTFHFISTDSQKGIDEGFDKRDTVSRGTLQRPARNGHARGRAQNQNTPFDYTLRAFLEPIDQEQWNIKPLPVRKTTAEDLTVISYPRLQSCSKLPEQFPVDDYPDSDPFLPWIHDVFPTHDGKFIQFVAQNKRRCRTGTTPAETQILKHMQPQAALFQHVAVQRVPPSADDTIRYRLSSHEEADADGIDTRFICRFKPTMQETLSVFNVNYDYAAWRKAHKQTFTVGGRDNKSIYTSQLLFQCPIPKELQDVVRTGTSVVNDRATLFVDIIPIRTPVRYGPPNIFMSPRYQEFQNHVMPFNTTLEWGNHVLPRIDDSGRWENFPICKPSLQTYEPYNTQDRAREAAVISAKDDADDDTPVKKHRLVACTWASAGYHTRGDRYPVNDGQRRLQEWIHFNLLVGVEHFYIYDNSAAHTNETSLKPITDLYPDQVTRINWPAAICNNNPNNVDSVGERSSQYAAEASCRLRFGPHVDWIGGFDIDEYLVPMGNHTSLTPLLDKLDNEGMKMIAFSSWRAWPRKQLIEEPVELKGKEACGLTKQSCFDLRAPVEKTLLQVYNCDRQKGPKTIVVPAEKQLYRPDYVKLHFVHYSTITELSAMNKSEYQNTGNRWWRQLNRDPKGRFTNELEEATMLHTKAMARQDTAGWTNACKPNGLGTCRIGNPYPSGAYEAGVNEDPEGWSYNCWVNEKVENYWVPRLVELMKSVRKPWQGMKINP